MNSLFNIINSNSSLENLKSRGLDCFAEIFSKYPKDAENIVKYINDCYNYNSEYATLDSADWDTFLSQRFDARGIDKSIKKKLTTLSERVFIVCIKDFLKIQNNKIYSVYVAKLALQKYMMHVISTNEILPLNSDGEVVTEAIYSIKDKGDANDILTKVTEELDEMIQKLNQKNIGSKISRGIDRVREEGRKVGVLAVATLEEAEIEG